MFAAVKTARPYPHTTRLIPAGEFQMGSKPGEGNRGEYPARRIFVSAFRIARTDTTVGEYTRYLEETAGIRHKAIIPGPQGVQEVLADPGEAKDVFARRMVERYCSGSITRLEFLTETLGQIPDFEWNKKGPDFPIVGLLHGEREAYCRYYGAKQLTHAQYERAAKGPSGEDEYGTPIERAVISDNGHQTTASVVGAEAELRVNGFDVIDLAGQVWKPVGRYEEHWYERLQDGDKDPENPLTDPQSQWLELRGGSWYILRRECARAAYRSGGGDPRKRLSSVGLRLALPQDSP